MVADENVIKGKISQAKKHLYKSEEKEAVLLLNKPLNQNVMLITGNPQRNCKARKKSHL